MLRQHKLIVVETEWKHPPPAATRRNGSSSATREWGAWRGASRGINVAVLRGLTEPQLKPACTGLASTSAITRCSAGSGEVRHGRAAAGDQSTRETEDFDAAGQETRERPAKPAAGDDDSAGERRATSRPRPSPRKSRRVSEPPGVLLKWPSVGDLLNSSTRSGVVELTSSQPQGSG